MMYNVSVRNVLALCCLITTLENGSAVSVNRVPNKVITTAAKGMSLLKPLFQAEAQLQALVLTGGGSEEIAASVAATIEENKKKNKIHMYTYGLSPFSTEAKAMLDASGYEYTNIELGLEWFLLNGEGSETRMALSREVDGGATSLPKIFVGEKCIGGCAELANLVETGEFDSLVKSVITEPKKEKKSFLNPFSF